jgi:hypothetical protein
MREIGRVAEGAGPRSLRGAERGKAVTRSCRSGSWIGSTWSTSEVRPGCRCEGSVWRRGSRSRVPWSTLLGASGHCRAARSSDLGSMRSVFSSSTWGVPPYQAGSEPLRGRGQGRCEAWCHALEVVVRLRFMAGVVDNAPEVASPLCSAVWLCGRLRRRMTRRQPMCLRSSRRPCICSTKRLAFLLVS